MYRNSSSYVGFRESIDPSKSVVSLRKGREKVMYDVLYPFCDLNKETSGPKYGKEWDWDIRERPCSSTGSKFSGWCPAAFHLSPLQSLL